MKKIIELFDHSINRLIKFITIALLVLMTAVVFAQVVFRLFHASIPWSEELSISTMVWCVFLGAALCCRQGSMIGLEIVQMILPRLAKKVVIALAGISTAAFLFVLSYVGIQISLQMWTQLTPIMKLPMGLIYAAIPTGAFLMAINTLFSTYESLEELKS